MTRILIAEDMAVFREPIHVTLEGEGYTVCSVSNGAQVLLQLEVFRPDLLLLDISMPDMDGLTVLKRVRETPEWAHLPVIMLTAVAEKDLVLQAKSLGVHAYLLKSYFSLTELLSTVREALARAKYSSNQDKK